MLGRELLRTKQVSVVHKVCTGAVPLNRNSSWLWIYWFPECQWPDGQTYDTKGEVSSFTCRDIVWLYHPQRKIRICPKLGRDWEGPYMFLVHINDIVYCIQWSRSKAVHCNQLWRYQGQDGWCRLVQHRRNNNGVKNASTAVGTGDPQGPQDTSVIMS